MNPAGYARLRELFDAAVALLPDDHQAFVDRHAPVGDPIRDELLAMLQARDSRFLATPISPAAVAQALGGSVRSIPQQIGPYRLLRELGRGGMGVVYQATRNDDVFQKIVALKVIGGVSDRAGLVERFKRERQILADLDHPNIARILDGGNTDEGLPDHVMEHVDGAPLDEHCDRGGLDFPERLRLVLEVCAAIAYLHEQSIIHRDIKPHNILVTKDGHAKLLDFGVAKAMTSNVSGDRHHTRVVTPGYASPEQIAGAEIGPHSDIYSLAVVSYELVTGRLPFVDAQGAPDLAAQLSGESPKPPSQVRSNDRRTGAISRVSGDLDRVLLMALQKDPHGRYRTIHAFAEDLECCLEGRPISARSDEWSYSLRLWVARNRFLSGLAALLVLSVLAGTWMMIAGRVYRTELAAKETEIERLVAILNGKVDRWQQTERPVSEAEKIADVRAAGDMLSPQALSTLSVQIADSARLTRVVGDLHRFLDRAEASSQSEPLVQREIALAYQRLGDLESDQSAPRVVDRVRATESFKRASAIVARVKPADPGWADRQLAELSARLARLGVIAPEIAVQAETPALKAHPRTDLPREPARPEPDAATRSPVGRVPDASRADQLMARFRTASLAADRTRANVQDLDAKLKAKGQVIRPGLDASMKQVDLLLNTVGKLLGQSDLSEAEELLRRVDYELKRLGDAVGR